MGKKIAWVLLLLVSMSGYAQKNGAPTDKNLASAKVYKALFPDEDIVLLSKETKVSFKRNTKRGFVEATTKKSLTFLNISQSAAIQHPVFYDSESEIKSFGVIDRKGRYLKYGLSQVRDEYMKSNDLFHTDYRVKYTNLSFQLQGVTKKVRTEKMYKDIKYFTSEYFVDSYRIKGGKLIVRIPDWLNLELKEFNFEGYDISKEETKDDDDLVITYTFNDMAPQISDSESPGPSHLYPHVLFIAKSYTNDGTEHTLFNDVSDLFAWYNGLVENVDVDASVYAGKVQELTTGAANDVEKTKNIFYWVQDNIRYIAFEDGIAGFQPTVHKTYLLNVMETAKGMAILTKSMLEEAGLDARLVWIGTDRLAYDYSIPSLSVDNHMICAVQLEGETIFLDGTEKYNRYGEYASRIQNKQALLQDNGSYKVMTVPMAAEKLNIDKTCYDLSISGEQLMGSVNRFYGGECRVLFQNIYTNFGKGDQEEVLINYLTGSNSNLKVTEVKPFDVEERDTDLNILYDIDLGNAVSEFDGTIYVDIDPVKRAGDYLFNERKVDYKARMNQQRITEVQLEIPNGYTLGDMPEAVAINNDVISIDVTYTVVGNKIHYKKAIDFKKRWIKKNEFDLWDESFSALKENLTQQITLIKQ